MSIPYCVTEALIYTCFERKCFKELGAFINLIEEEWQIVIHLLEFELCATEDKMKLVLNWNVKKLGMIC